MRLADRTRHLTPFKVVDFIQAAVELQAQGRDIVRMAIGEPGFATAGPIVESAKQALAEGKTFYTPPLWYTGIAPSYRRLLPTALWPDY